MFLLLAGFLPWAAASSEVTSDLPAATNVLARMAERATAVATDDHPARYTYHKRSRLEELNADGETVRTTEKLYDVVLIHGWPFTRLVKIQGQDLSPEEIERQNEREQAFRTKIAGRDPRRMAEKKEPWVSSELLDRFDFTVLSNEVRRSRNTFVLRFKPKSGNAEKSVQDRILNRLAGRIWVDAEDAEVARLEVHLTEEFSLGWLGILGSLKACDLRVERQRLPDGTWVHKKNSLFLLARKVFSPMRIRSTEESSDFVRTAE